MPNPIQDKINQAKELAAADQDKLKAALKEASKPEPVNEGLLGVELANEAKKHFAQPAIATKRDILEEAIGTVAERDVSYDAPEDNFERIANYWNMHLENCGITTAKPLAPHNVAQMMALMKLARLDFNPTHHDSWVDTAGYAGCGGQIAAKMRAK